ncbi:MAG TPA: DUF2190 domain-containing protein [Rhodospirillaceae bacterium]|nr:DUF2190 domain-containing protein [Magnetovibrio sp.]HBT44311.1 DUF2190 domain-containing protein [Rhodospirillaceae bacterium]HCS70084.1 DUF2190 domain-containing protein [Rhodospirillaceae bacterium]|tara:strand:+ start:1731 stop:2144 length:414 start_codon:yes stop_codon:yes gene_type:complete
MPAQKHPILTLTATASGAVAANRAVKYSDAQADTQGEKVKGVAAYAAADGQDFAVDVMGTTIIEAGDDVVVGDSLIVDAQGRAIPSTGALAVAAGATAVTSTAANGAILEGADLPEFVFADAVQAGGLGDLIEIKLR